MARGNGVPAPPAPFIGRTDALDWLTRHVRAGARVAVTAAGVTGVGRTALVQAFARDAQFDTALWWSTCLDGNRPHLALRRWAMRCGLPVDGVGTLPGLLQAVALGLPDAGTLLVVIDGVDTGDVDAVLEVLSALPEDAAVLLTTSTAAVAEALDARTLVLAPMHDDDARALLEAVADERMPPMVVHTVLEAADRLPLALRVVACRMRGTDPDEATGIWGLPPAPGAVARLGGNLALARATLLVLDRASDATARVFRALGVLTHGPIQPARVASLLEISEASAFDHLHQLVELGLVVGAGGVGRWQVHTAHLEHARNLLAVEDELDALYLARVAEAVESEGAPSAGFGPLDLLDTFERAIRRGDVDHLVALAMHAAPAVSGWCHEAAQELVAAAMAAAEAASHPEVDEIAAQMMQLDAVAAVAVATLEVAPLRDDAVSPSTDTADDAEWVDIVELSGGVGDDARAAVEVVDLDLDDDPSKVEPVVAVEPIERVPAEVSGAVPVVEVEELDAPDELSLVDEASVDDVSSLPLEPLDNEITTLDDDEVATQAISTAAIEAAMAAARGRPRPTPAPAPAPAPVEPHEAFLREHGLSLVWPVDALDAPSGSPEQDGPTQIFDIGRMMAFVRGAQSEQARDAAVDRARVAAEAATALHARAVELVQGIVAAEPTSDSWRDARARLLGSARKLAEHVRSARAAASAATDAPEAASARRASERAERAHEAAIRAMAVVERAWTDAEDARVEAVESRARAVAAVHRARSDAALARQGVEEAERRVQAGKDTAGPSVAEAFDEVDAALGRARAAAEEAGVLASQVDAGDIDPEIGAAEVARLRTAADDASAQAVERLSRSARNVRAEQRRQTVLEEAREQAERVDRDAAWIASLGVEIEGLLRDRDDVEAKDLRGRLRELVGNVERHRVRAAEAVEELQIAAERGWRELLDHVAAAGRATTDGLQEAERLRADVDAWAALEVEASEDVVLAGLQAEAATALAGLEATAAVAWRAASRAHQAAAHHEGGLVDAIGALKEGELRLRTAVEQARQGLRQVIDAPELAVARARWTEAGVWIEDAEDASAESRALAEALLEAADARRRAHVDEQVAQGEIIAARIDAVIQSARSAAAEVRELAEDFPDEPTEALGTLAAIEARVEDTGAAVHDGVQRLRRARDGDLAERLVAAISEAAELVSGQLAEIEQVQLQMRSLHEVRFDPGYRRQQAEDVLDEARAAIAAARAEVDAVRTDAGPAIEVVATALGESVSELDGASALLDAAPDLGDAAGGWDAAFEELVARADAVTRLTERVRQATLSARSLLAMVQQRRKDEVADARARAAAPWDEAIAEARAVIGQLVDPPDVDDAWPVPVGRIHLAWQQAIDGVHGALVALETLAARVEDGDDGAALLPRVAALRAQVEAEADRARRRADDLTASVAAWHEHRRARAVVDDARVAVADEAATLVDPGVKLSSLDDADDAPAPATVPEPVVAPVPATALATEVPDVDMADDATVIEPMEVELSADPVTSGVSFEEVDVEVLDATAIAAAPTASDALRAGLQDAALRAALSADEVASLARDAAMEVAEAGVDDVAQVAALEALATHTRSLADGVEAQVASPSDAVPAAEQLAAAEAACDAAEAALLDARELHAQASEAVASASTLRLQGHRRAARACLDEANQALAVVRDRHDAAVREAASADDPAALAADVDALAALRADAEAHAAQVREAVERCQGDDEQVAHDAALDAAAAVASMLRAPDEAGRLLDAVQAVARAQLTARLDDARGRADVAGDQAEAARQAASEALAWVRTLRTELGERAPEAAVAVERASHTVADAADVTTAHVATVRQSGSATQALASAEHAVRSASGLAGVLASMDAARRMAEAAAAPIREAVAREQAAERARRGNAVTQVQAAIDAVRVGREVADGLVAPQARATGLLEEIDGVVEALADWRRDVRGVAAGWRAPSVRAAVVDAQAAIDAAWALHAQVVAAVHAATRATSVRVATQHAEVAEAAAGDLSLALDAARDAVDAVTEAVDDADAARRAAPTGPGDAVALRRSGAPSLALDAALAAQASGADLPDVARAALALGVAQAWLGLGHAAAARDAVAQARALSDDAEVGALADRIAALADRATPPAGAVAAWALSKDARRRARRVVGP
ncbi:MAG: hypothetical protein H6733_13495 [Alphaproteobacteria bacterium]|nr:hypothetical protein [Alphaproteobacteria bacterium]